MWKVPTLGVLFGRKCPLKSRRIQTIYFEQNQQRLERLGIASGVVQKFLRDIGYNCHLMRANDTRWIAYFNKA